MHVPLSIGAIEPLESRIALAESGVHERHCIGRHVTFATDAFQRTQHFLGLIRAPGFRQDVSAKRQHLAVTTQGLGFLQRFERQLAVPQPLVDRRELEVANPERRTDGCRPLCEFER